MLDKAVLEKLWKDEDYVCWGCQIIGFLTILYKKVTPPENLRNDHKIWKTFLREHIIKINTKTVRELRIIAKDKGLRGYFKLKKDDLVTLLLEQSTEEMPAQPPRARGEEGRSVLPVKIISNP